MRALKHTCFFFVLDQLHHVHKIIHIHTHQTSQVSGPLIHTPDCILENISQFIKMLHFMLKFEFY